MCECVCCHDPLLRHIEGNQLQWFCRRCWQFMPVIERKHIDQAEPAIISRQRQSHLRPVPPLVLLTKPMEPVQEGWSLGQHSTLRAIPPAS